MPAYVFAPITGRVSQGPGCNANHATCGAGYSPIDIGGTGDIYLYVNYPTVKSIRIIVGSLCCNAGTGADYRRTVKVELYGQLNASCYFGSVLYGHIRDLAVQDGVYNLTSYSLRIGRVIEQGLGPGTCYTAAHVHMQHGGGATVYASCLQNVTAGTTTIYSWGYCAL